MISIIEKGYNNVNSLHGDKTQGMRDRVMQSFRKGYCNYLVATDVAARGLDISDIDIVINIDMPQNIEDYVHRIGRTARGTSNGLAYTFFTKYDSKLAKDLVDVMTRSKQLVPDELLKYVPKRSGGSSGGNGSRDNNRGYSRSRSVRSNSDDRFGYGINSSNQDSRRYSGNNNSGENNNSNTEHREGRDRPRSSSYDNGNRRNEYSPSSSSSSSYSSNRPRSRSYDDNRSNNYNNDTRSSRSSSSSNHKERVIDLSDHLSEDYINAANNSLGGGCGGGGGFQEQSDLYMNHKSNSDTGGSGGNSTRRRATSGNNYRGSSSGSSNSNHGSRHSDMDDAPFDKFRQPMRNVGGGNGGTSSFRKVHAVPTV